ncbi:hypothetical protein RJ640_026220 [Escallonia rubra]|uniref:N-acetyltransferase domain-containing protein n=1 Tax=Escallonia rubra TaxID=112253 RepID=A0AA88UUJ6_9ASTE|nr:hypothetical protein RJ640_026220 [Escallonia rubra]
MAVAGSIYGGCLPSTHRNSSPKMSTQKRPPPLFVSTDPTHVNPLHLRDLYSLCNHSCHRFPILDPAGRVEPVELDKLRVAVSNSSLVVSVFANPDELYSSSNMTGVGGNWLRRLVPVTPFNGRLVGFGRAISDFGLTASIYDVMVMPTLQGRGIGRMIVQRLIRFFDTT